MAYVQLKAGHSQSAITERYIHAAQVLFPGAAARGEERIFGRKPPLANSGGPFFYIPHGLISSIWRAVIPLFVPSSRCQIKLWEPALGKGQGSMRIAKTALSPGASVPMGRQLRVSAGLSTDPVIIWSNPGHSPPLGNRKGCAPTLVSLTRYSIRWPR